MGDPKRHRKKYSKPSHPWIKERIETEKVIVKEYGIRRKQELWKMESILTNLQYLAKNIIGSASPQSEKEKVQLLARVYRLGLLPKDARVEDILNLKLKNILERRLETIVQKKKMAHTMLQARQFITHGHISVNGKKITAPSHLVTIEEEGKIIYAPFSTVKEALIIKPQKPSTESKEAKEAKPASAA